MLCKYLILLGFDLAARTHYLVHMQNRALRAPPAHLGLIADLSSPPKQKLKYYLSWTRTRAARDSNLKRSRRGCVLFHRTLDGGTMLFHKT
jgi:hypothetical protein